MANFLLLTGGNNNGGNSYQLFASCKGGETAGSVARNSAYEGALGGETAGSVAFSSTGSGSACSSSSSGSFTAIG